jgi:acetyl-CoA carboxylase biotin carboxylase subunit
VFKRVLIANRGEIAIRIIRACREMGIETVSIYSVPDQHQLHVQMADQSICVGPAQAAYSYLNVASILSAAVLTNCDAIHPGYGFLSENPDFVRAVEACGITFIGPSADVIEQMGDKSAAKKCMESNGVPTVPGSDGPVATLEEAIKVCREIGFPVLIKASSGGGGRGMRRVDKEEEVRSAFDSARSEAKACFADDRVYIEKLILNPRHIEFQILADHLGNVVHLGERDCSIQRKNQKMLEESPSLFLDDDLREKMGTVAIRAAKACGYKNAGTVEFVVDKEKNFYFIEMNTRIQVEHPVTEMVTGIDLIKEQLRIASDLPLSVKQDDICMRGWAMECRINAEIPQKDFTPSSGEILFLHEPGGMNIRFDSLLYTGGEVSPFYDSMIGKIIVLGNNRLEAIRKLRCALEETIIEGVQTNSAFQYTILHDPDFIRGQFDTGFMEKKKDALLSLMVLEE